MRNLYLNKKYIGITLTIIIIIFSALFYAKLFYTSSQKKILNTLSEISNQSVQVLQKEIEKEKNVIINLAALIGESDFNNVDTVITKLKSLHKINEWKRMGIILSNGIAYTTDNKQFDLSDRIYFKESMNGKCVISDTLTDKSGGENINVYSAPVVFKDGTKAVLFATYNTKLYKSSLSASIFSQEGYSYIVKENGDCIVDSEHKNSFGEFSNIFISMKQTSSKNITPINNLKNALVNHKQGNITFFNDIPYYMYYQPLNINDWYLLIITPVSVVQKNINGMLSLAYSFIILCICVFIILTIHIIKIQRKNQKKLEKIAFIDKVTGASTYERFKLDAAQLLSNYGKLNYSIICLNIEKFQYINDLCGYEEGNHVLTFISNTISNHISSNETFTRFSGDHFLLLLSNKENEELIQRINNIQEKLSNYNKFDKKLYDLKITAGIYRIEDSITEIDAMVDRANMALNKKSENVLDKYIFYDDTLLDEKIKIKNIEDKFTLALKHREFVVYYQAKYNISYNCFEGAEALVRWIHPKTGFISPGVFIPILENNGYIVELDQYVFEEVCRQIRQWLDKGYSVTPVSINISRLHLYQIDFVDNYLSILHKYKVPVELIQLELTETVLFDNENILIDIMEQLHKDGIKILMDDFGSGYSSINMLKNIPIDILKIDKSLIDGFDKNHKSQQIIISIITLAQKLGIQVTAEGVETKEQYEFLKTIGCDYIQGYYCAKPKPVKDYEKILISPNSMTY